VAPIQKQVLKGVENQEIFQILTSENQFSKKIKKVLKVLSRK